MKLTDFSIICDENIHPAVIDFIKAYISDVKSISDLGLLSQNDETILNKAYETNSIVITHDSDFGKIVFFQKMPFTGIVYLRPGHIIPLFTIETLHTLFETDFDIEAPFMLVAERTKAENIKVRIRNL